jgi:hypothetical protein
MGIMIQFFVDIWNLDFLKGNDNQCDNKNLMNGELLFFYLKNSTIDTTLVNSYIWRL